MDERDRVAIRPDALSPAQIEEKAEAVGAGKASMPVGRAFILAVMAGLFIGMGGMYMLLIKSDATLPYVASQLLGGLGFCLGLFLVVAAGAELFTGNCLMVCGALSNRLKWGAMFKSWSIVYLGNLIGSLLLAALLFFAGYASGNAGGIGNAMITVAASKVAQPFLVLLLKGIMCNLLVCLAVWICFASRTIIDKFVAILLPISAFVACGFEHCVANMFFLPMGLLMKMSGFDYAGPADMDALGFGSALTNLTAVTIGNIIGGAVFVGMAYWLAFRRPKAGATA
ncbi:MAG: formate/nitrite transporter family protein [Coriobacteriales bacterium]|nr:formate/nitrite transporter family protein [Coriobacteriales bacterium]